MFVKIKLTTLLFLGCASIVWSQSYSDRIDSLKSLLVETTDGVREVDLLNEITYAFRRVSADSMAVYSDLTFDRMDNLDYPKGRSIAFKNRGIIKYKQGGYFESVIDDYEKSIELAASIGDMYTQAACYNNIALVYQSVFKLQDALKYFFKAYDLYINGDLPNDRLKGLIIGNIGTAYHRLGDKEKEFKYLKEALDYAEQNNFKSVYAIYCDNYAKALINRGEYRQAIAQAQKGIEIQEKLGDNQSYIQTLHTLSFAHLKLKEYDQGLDRIRESIELAKRYSYGLSLTEGYTIMIQLYRAQGKSEQAIEAGLTGYSNVLQMGNYEEGVIITRLLYELYETAGDTTNAYVFMKEYLRFNKESNEQNAQMIVSQMEAKYQNQIKEREILTLSREKEFQKKQSTFFLLMSILLSGLLLYTYMLYKEQQKTRKVVETKNVQLALAEIDLAEKNNELKKYIESNIQLEQFAHVASHDLKSPLRTISSFTGLLRGKVLPKLSGEEIEYFDFIENGTKQMSGLVNDLLDYSRANSQEVNIGLFCPKRLINKVLDNMQGNINETSTVVDIKDMPTEIEADEVKLKRVFQNLISNAIKFVLPDQTPKITIVGDAKGDFYEFSVSDNGIGIQSKYKEKVFLPYNRLNATDEYDGTGMGLAICKKLVEQHNGTISIDSNEHGGTTVTFTISRKLGVNEG